MDTFQKKHTNYEANIYLAEPSNFRHAKIVPAMEGGVETKLGKWRGEMMLEIAHPHAQRA